MPPLNLTSRLAAFPLILLVLVLQGCFHDDDDPAPVVIPVPDANPVGYYDVSGTASVGDGSGGTLSITDLQAMVNGNRLMMMSVDEGLLYDGTITSISGNDFTADVTIYTDGDNPVTATVSGTITEGSSISGTLTGTGIGSGIFSLLYATTNNQMADIARIENGVGNPAWQAKIGGSVFTQEFTINNAGVLTENGVLDGGVFISCELDGNVTPISGSSLYSISLLLTDCGSSTRDGTYTGLATSRTQANLDDTLVFAVTDGRYSPNADFE